MNRLSKLLVLLAIASLLTVPVFAGQVMGEVGGLDTLIMATVLLAFVFFMQKFTKK